jgi:2-isopropylmalate synthase
VHPRHPYGGDLVHTAFSGTHQDAISKGLAHHARTAAELGVPAGRAPWAVPYLPIDPADVGRTYEAVIRVNSQSGKGGVAYLLKTHHGVDLPERMRPDFSRVVQKATDASGREATPKELYELFRTTYLLPEGDVLLQAWSTHRESSGTHRFVCTLQVGDRSGDYEGTGNGPLSAFADALAGAGLTVDILDFHEHATAAGPDSEAVAYAQCRVDGATRWGAGRDTSVLTASVQAVLSAVNGAGAL